MDLYLLNSDLQNTEIVERYESVVWTERFSSLGDVQIVIDPALAEPGLRTLGSFLAIKGSERVMRIESAVEANAEDGSRKLTVTGSSLECILDERPNTAWVVTSSVHAPQTFTNPPATIMRQMFDAVVRNNAFINENIPLLQAQTVVPVTYAIPEPSASVSVITDVDTLYNTLKNVADVYKIGFRLIRKADNLLYFDVYTGFDRTTKQLVLPPMVFSPELDNLSNTSELASLVALRNVAYVYSPAGSTIVYRSGSNNQDGFNKRILIVNASDISLAAGAALTAALQQRGQEELAKTVAIYGFDGQIPQNSSYVYGTHYGLGDLVEQRSTSGASKIMQVTEQIFTSDSTGDKSYPTLIVNSLIAPGSWDALNASRTWNSYTTETWNSMT